MFDISTDVEQKVCEVGCVKFGGLPGEYPTVVCNSIFQKGDNIFGGKRKGGFDEKLATDFLARVTTGLCPAINANSSTT